MSDDDEDCNHKNGDDYNITVKDNYIIFHGMLNDKSCFEIISSLDTVVKNIQKHDNYGEGNIMFHINSCGGNVYAALSVVEHMRRCRYPITTICEGCVASAAVLISLAGTKRIIGKHSYMMIHEIRNISWGKFSELKDQMQNNKKIMKDMKGYLRERTGDKLPKEQLDDLLKHDILWGHKKCLKYGLVDSVS